MSNYSIMAIRGHYEVYDADGNFVCSADSYSEAISEISAA